MALEIFAYISIVFLIMQLIVALFNLATIRILRLSATGTPLLSILIPARNEESNIGNIIKDIQNQNYQNFELIIYDDNSTDKTAEIVAGFAQHDSRIRLIKATYLPEQWLGKNYACHRMSLEAQGRYFLFLDADVRLHGSIVENSVARMQKDSLTLFSIFPQQKMLKIGEKLTVPIMNHILVSILPLALVQWSKFVSLSAANGQFMLFHSETYRAIQPHSRVKNNKVEDIAISRLYKRQKQKIACTLADERLQCRMYNGFSDALQGFARNISQFFGGSVLVAILFWILTIAGFLPVLLFWGFNALILYLCFFLILRSITSLVSKQSILENVCLYYPQHVVFGLMLWFNVRNTFLKKHLWKGRAV